MPFFGFEREWSALARKCAKAQRLTPLRFAGIALPLGGCNRCSTIAAVREASQSRKSDNPSQRIRHPQIRRFRMTFTMNPRCSEINAGFIPSSSWWNDGVLFLVGYIAAIFSLSFISPV